MNQNEQMEIYSLPWKYKPMSAWAYWGLRILYAVPIIGQIFLIIHAISDSNINRRSFARSYFCTLILILILLISVGGFSAIEELISELIS